MELSSLVANASLTRVLGCSVLQDSLLSQPRRPGTRQKCSKLAVPRKSTRIEIYVRLLSEAAHEKKNRAVGKVTIKLRRGKGKFMFLRVSDA